MVPLRRFEGVPPSLSGRSRHDPFIGLLDRAVTGVWRLTGSIRDMAEPRTLDHTITLVVRDRQVVAHDHDVIALRLGAADGQPLPRWHPGAHIDLRLPSGILRQYSLCGDPADADSYRIAVRRIPAGGGGSVEVHHDLVVGSTVSTCGPRNAFPLTLPGHGVPTRALRFIAGGIGITPILPMLNRAHHQGVDWSMVYTGRSRDSLPFLDEVAAFGDRVDIRTDDVHGLPSADDLLGECPSGTAVYACGPAPLLNAVRARLADRDDVELHFERFAAPPVVDGHGFAVSIVSTGESVPVAADETILTAFDRAGIRMPYSCKQGFCGTCRTRVIGGAVDHRDTLLTESERTAGMMLVCVSRAVPGGDLTLDL